MIIRKNYVVVVGEGSAADSIDVEETVVVSQIDTSDCPNGYVHLRLFGLLQFNWEPETFQHCVSNHKFTAYWAHHYNSSSTFTFHGPAKVYECVLGESIDVDFVPSIRLLAWPSAAQSWIFRERKYAWPSDALISEIQRNGCDLVQVSHRDYKHVLHQWRYSFSRAEVTLIRSWTPTQQLVYHMLRYFSKHTIICEWGDKVICTYHIKTLMLWTCERKSPFWWELNCVLVLCSNLLDTLIRWIRKKICPHYFIPEWNLFDYNMEESRRFDTIEFLRIHTNIRILSEWFRIRYLSRVFNKDNDEFDNLEHQHALNVIAESNRFNREFHKLLKNWVDKRYCLYIMRRYETGIMKHCQSLKWNATRFCTLIFSRNLAPKLQFLNFAVAALRLTQDISGMRKSPGLSNHELLDVLSEVVLKLSGQDSWKSSTPYNIPFKQCSKWYFIKGVRLLSIYCEKHSAAYCLWVKTCKRYFKSALGIQDEYSESIHDACHVYLAALYYVSEANQETIITHLMEAKNENYFNRFVKPRILSYSTLLFVDTVAHVSGFCFLFNHVLQNENALPANECTLPAIVYSLIFSVLRMNKLNSLIKIDRTETAKLSFTSLFDRCLWTVSVHKYRRTTHSADREWSSNIPNKSSNTEEEMHFCLAESLEETLMKISVELFTKYYEMQFITMTVIGFPYRCKIVSHFKALYHYRRCEYVELLKMCDLIISQEKYFITEKVKSHEFLADFRDMDMFCVSEIVNFQTLFKNDITCAVGLINLTLSVLDTEPVVGSSIPHNQKYSKDESRGVQPIRSVNNLFLTLFMRFQSLHQLHFPIRDLLSALNDLKHVSTGFAIEAILIVCAVKTLKRLQH